MTRRVAAILLVAACDRGASKDPPAPMPGSAVAVPDVTSVDWPNRSYELASLGTVKATNGRAAFRMVEEDDGVYADQSPTATGAESSLVLAPAHYADLDGDSHDEALIPFEMRTAQIDDVQHLFGVFAYTMREGEPVRIAVVTASTVFDIDGATLTTGDPPKRWRWRAGAFVAE